MSIITKLKRWIFLRAIKKNGNDTMTVSVLKGNMKRGSNCRLKSALLHITNATKKQGKHTQESIIRSIALNASITRNFTMNRKSGYNTYKDGVLIHKPEWGMPQVSDGFHLPMSRRERKAFLKKSNLKRLYKKLIGNENT